MAISLDVDGIGEDVNWQDRARPMMKTLVKISTNARGVKMAHVAPRFAVLAPRGGTAKFQHHYQMVCQLKIYALESSQKGAFGTIWTRHANEGAACLANPNVEKLSIA